MNECIMNSGLILYNGQLGTGGGDFVSIGMRDGRAELRFDMGSGPAIIESDPLSLNEWHVLRAKRRDVSGKFMQKKVGFDCSPSPERAYIGWV